MMKLGYACAELRSAPHGHATPGRTRSRNFSFGTAYMQQQRHMSLVLLAPTRARAGGGGIDPAI
jgi:hypothetical protein